MYPSGGKVYYDRWVWLGAGVAVFCFFGMGRDAVKMYREMLVRIGLGKVFPSLNVEYMSRQTSARGSTSSIGSKAKMLLKKSSISKEWKGTVTSTITSTSSRSESGATPISPKNVSFMETISESTPDPDKGGFVSRKPSVMERLSAAMKSKKRTENEVDLANMAGEQTAVHSNISTAERPPLVEQPNSNNSLEVIVRKEVRQDSETAETAPPSTPRSQ
jgi:pheromone a factor receptor